ncbi:hypothetical protein [Streptomyces sporangiiformans]|uniref:Uncharacterized protein n=1 Tax=Streptomyces sporangiiformans TaxID=2315329 RepID=A0A505D224_9ACTN|nr:hypothetical protein [Streptomyces sporangiiformans]TPQ16837.1 hypothetical protein FGD71_040270 [Streptomyces sporangiiformans]
MLADLSPLIAATTQWLTYSYPSGGGALDSTLSDVQARQGVTVAAWLRYPTPMDAALVGMAGPGGSARLDWITGADGAAYETGADAADEYAWRTWVDEVVASWAACLLIDSALATTAVAALADCGHMARSPVEFRRLVAPDERDRRAAALLRHPDLLAPIADLHRAGLMDRLKPGEALTA